VKQSAILVMLTEPMDAMNDHERDVVRRFLTQKVRGLSPDHHRRWLRFLKRLTAGEVQEFYPILDRAGPYHARHMAIERLIFENQEGFPASKAGERAFRNWLKVGASLVSLEIHDGEAKWLPGSLKFEEISDDEMREFHEAAIDFLHIPYALKRLWPAVKGSQRTEMLDTLLTNPNQQEEHA
jgi:hypothetical protein